MCNFVWLSQKITLFGLQPFEEYEVAVLAFNSVGEGPAVKKLIRTAEGSKIFIPSTYRSPVESIRLGFVVWILITPELLYIEDQ